MPDKRPFSSRRAVCNESYIYGLEGIPVYKNITTSRSARETFFYEAIESLKCELLRSFLSPIFIKIGQELHV